MKLFAIALSTAFCASATIQITVKHIDPTVPDSFYAEDGLQTAIDDPLTTCGDIIEIDHGAARHFSYPYILRGPSLPHSLGGPASAPSYAKDCASSGKYITIRSSLAYQLTPGKRVGAADAAYLAFVGGVPLIDGLSCTVFVVEYAASYWRLQGLEISPSAVDCSSGGRSLIITSYTVYGGNYSMGRLDQFPNHITIDQGWLHGLDGYPLREGILLDGNMMTVSNSTIENVHVGLNPSSESHAITLESGRGPVQIFNNKMSSQHINLISGGEITSTLRGVEYVEFTGNWLYRPFKWLDWAGVIDPTPSSPCPLDSDGHGATYHNTANPTYWECQGAAPGTWVSLSAGAYTALVAARLPGYQKNLIEFKRMTNYHMEGNLLDQSAVFSGDNQIGTCLMLAMLDGPSGKNENILAENNICRHAGSGFRTGYDLAFKNPNGDTHFWANGGRPIHNVVVRNNLFHNMGENIYTHPGFGDDYGVTAFGLTSGFSSFTNNIQDAFTIDHNTWDGRLTGGNDATSYGIRPERSFDAYTWDGLVPINQRVTNNIISEGQKAISNGSGHRDVNAVSQAWGPYAEITANGFVDNIGIGPDTTIANSLTYHCVPATDGCPYGSAYNTYPPNCLGTGKKGAGTMPGGCLFDVPANLGFTSYPDDLTLQSGSPLKAAGLDGKDLGADLNTVNWATAGAESGVMAPYLVMKIRLIRPASTSAFIRFSAIDTSSCTVAARVYGFPLSTPAATVAVNTGDLDRTATLTGLTANTKYGLKVTCAGSYYREADFRTP